MPYCVQAQVETWSQKSDGDIGSDSHAYSYVDTITYLISVADRAIDDECGVPEEFFEAGGVAVADEMHNGVELGYASSWVENPYYMTGVQPLLRLNYKPILAVATVESQTSAGAWTVLVVDVDYAVDPLGIRFIKNFPRYAYANIKVNYTAGYAATPAKVSAVSAQLAASIIQRVLKSESASAGTSSSASLGPASRSSSFSAGGLDGATIADACFSDRLKADLARFRNVTPPRVV